MKVTPSSGNVFRDLRFPAEQSEHLLIRADLLLQLQKALATQDLTQVQAARLLRVSRRRVNDLLRGRLDLFSTDSVIDMLARLGVRVRFVLTPVHSRLAVARARPTTRRIDYSEIPEASAQQLKTMWRQRPRPTKKRAH